MIPLRAVRDAAFWAARRPALERQTGQRPIRFAAMTRHPCAGPDCWALHRRLAAIEPGGLHPMSRGRLADLASRVQRDGGCREVRLTWRTGIKALRAELEGGWR